MTMEGLVAFIEGEQNHSRNIDNRPAPAHTDCQIIKQIIKLILDFALQPVLNLTSI